MITFDQKPLGRAFPAAHIALLNNDPEAAIEIWRRTPHHQDLDITGASLAHLALRDDRPDLLVQMWQHNPQSLHEIGEDDLGLNLMKTAIVLDSPYCLSILHASHVKTNSPRDLFALAVVVNSPKVLIPLLETKQILPPFTAAIMKAIVAGNIEVAQALRPNLTLSEHHSFEDILMLANFAENCGYHEFASNIRGTEQGFATSSMAIEDILAAQAHCSDWPLFNDYGDLAELSNHQSGVPLLLSGSHYPLSDYNHNYQP